MKQKNIRQNINTSHKKYFLFELVIKKTYKYAECIKIETRNF